LLAFPADPRRQAGFELGKIQAGLDPSNWRPFSAVGAGTRKVRIKDVLGIYRVMYVAKFEEAVYVLHCFQMKTLTTSEHDKTIAEERYRAVLEERKT
jgi:phage-related protein